MKLFALTVLKLTLLFFAIFSWHDHNGPINWWKVAFIVSAVVTQIRDYVPKPSSAPGLISSPWYPLLYHGLLDLLSLSFLRGLQGLANGKTLPPVPPAEDQKPPDTPKP